ncbi:hypothetical protein Y024_5155 [Burkholderia pseudomallei TSV44]|nr:hypothetical protein Y024_5155 [Burkholderia pseudomallei TSV44]
MVAGFITTSATMPAMRTSSMHWSATCSTAFSFCRRSRRISVCRR